MPRKRFVVGASAVIVMLYSPDFVVENVLTTILLVDGGGSSVPLKVSLTLFDGETTPPQEAEKSAAMPRATAKRERMLSFRKSWRAHCPTAGMGLPAARRDPRLRPQPAFD